MPAILIEENSFVCAERKSCCEVEGKDSLLVHECTFILIFLEPRPLAAGSFIIEVETDIFRLAPEGKT